MPSSKDRRRVELPTYLYERLRLMAESEERTVTSLLLELLQTALPSYHPTWTRFFKDRYDERARRALELAKEEARGLGHNYVGTEHLLLGLLRVEDGIAAQVLRQLWVDLDKMRAGVAYIATNAATLAKPAVASVNLVATDGEFGFTLRARKVLAMAVDEAQSLHHDHVGTEHLLLALEAEGQGIAAGLLQTVGALGKVREFTLAALQQPVESAESAGKREPEGHAQATGELHPQAGDSSATAGP
jgi:ATP-dependent Clp protease ATP-binding subunit ClpC